MTRTLTGPSAPKRPEFRHLVAQPPQGADHQPDWCPPWRRFDFGACHDLSRTAVRLRRLR
jgi:hypothetical protein